MVRVRPLARRAWRVFGLYSSQGRRGETLLKRFAAKLRVPERPRKGADVYEIVDVRFSQNFQKFLGAAAAVTGGVDRLLHFFDRDRRLSTSY